MMSCSLRTALLFLQGGIVLCIWVGSHHTYGYSDSYVSPDTRNLTSLFDEKKVSLTIVFGQGSGTDSRFHHIITTITQERKAVVLDLDMFNSVMPSKIALARPYDNLDTLKRHLNFLIVADIEETQSVLYKAQKLDGALGAGTLLRHFSKWLVLLTEGSVNALIVDDIVLDNVAITSFDNVYGSLCKWLTCKIHNETISGLCYKLISYLAEAYNFSFVFVEPEDRSWGVYRNDSWDGIIGLLVNESVDISAVPYARNRLRSNYVTYMYPISYTYTDILYKKPDSSVQWTVLLSCFKWQVYVCGIAVLVGVAALFVIFKGITAHSSGRNFLDRQQTIETIMATIGVTCNQGSSLLPNTTSQRILLSFWWLFCIVILSVYSGNLIAKLAVTNDNVPFSGIDNLLDSGYDIGISAGSNAAVIMGESNDSVYAEIWTNSHLHRSDDEKYHATRLAKGRYAYFTDRITINSYMMEIGGMAHTKERFFQTMTSLILPKHSSLALLMDPGLMFLVERGIMDQWYEMSIKKNSSSLEVEHNGLEAKDLFTALIVAACGVGLAVGVLLFEICKSKVLT